MRIKDLREDHNLTQADVAPTFTTARLKIAAPTAQYLILTRGAR